MWHFLCYKKGDKAIWEGNLSQIVTAVTKQFFMVENIFDIYKRAEDTLKYKAYFADSWYNVSINYSVYTLLIHAICCLQKLLTCLSLLARVTWQAGLTRITIQVSGSSRSVFVTRLQCWCSTNSIALAPGYIECMDNLLWSHAWPTIKTYYTS